MKTKILITGASGFLGHRVLEKIGKDVDITLLLRKKLKFNFQSKAKIILGDITDTKIWQKKIIDIDVIVHLAGITHADAQDLYKKINTQGTQNLITLSVEKKVKQFVYISTRASGKNCGAYGESKLAAEAILKKSGLKFTILRVGEAYDDNFKAGEGLGNLAKRLMSLPAVPFPSGKNVTMSPIHIDDIADCIRLCINNSKTFNKTYTLSGPETLSFRQVLERLAKYKKVRRIFIPIPITLVKMLFAISPKILGASSSDQLDRLLCRKNPLSVNVAADLGVHPRKFLAA